MSYLALARKWRPKNFSEMVGQEHVLRALINALDSDRLHHAFLFTGTRGVGKTTIARILAKSINCEQGISATPCGECSTCQEVDEGRFVDLIEVDAASRTKVEDTRDLLDNVQYAPSRGRYKVYLIDEVHMLSASSFNALLKTLEEPPPHVKFLFATTDPKKLPVTVLSRCLQFNLRRLSTERIASYCQSLLDKENIPYEEAACKQLAIAADGSMRDGLSLLDQSIAYGAGSVKLDDVTAMLGSFDNSLVIHLVERLMDEDASGVMLTLAKLAEQVPDLKGVLQAVLNILHGIALYQQVPDACESMLEESGLGLETVAALASKITAEEVQLYYQIGLTGQRDLYLAPSARSGLEMVLLRMLAFKPGSSNKTVGSVNHINAANHAGAHGSVNSKHSATLSPVEEPLQKPNNTIQTHATGNESVPEIHEGSETDYQQSISAPGLSQAASSEAASNVTIQSPWHEIVAALAIAGADRQLASQCVLSAVNGHDFVLNLPPANAPYLNKDRQERIQQALIDLFSVNIKVTIEMKESETESPAMREQRIEKEKIATAEAIINADANVKTFLEAFDGAIQPGSVQPVE